MRLVVESPPHMDRPSAFIFYRPHHGPGAPQVTYTHEAWRILSPPPQPSGHGVTALPELGSLCARWTALLGARPEPAGGPGKEDRQESGRMIDVYQSGRRQYAVRGIILSAAPSAPSQTSRTQEAQYLFLLERIVPTTDNLARMARQWRLNRREQEVVGLLLADRSNKEIAGNLGLSLNTIKGYLKLLMRKVGASSRTGIVARLLTAPVLPPQP